MSGHTPTPWRWELNLKSKSAQLCGGDPKAGFGAFDLTVVDFVRWGMNGAQPRFRNDHNIMIQAQGFGVAVVGREHHAAWFQDISHPDARFIVLAVNHHDALVAALRDAEHWLSEIYSDADGDEKTELRETHPATWMAIDKWRAILAAIDKDTKE